jgi:hypothetical protein
MSNLVRSAELKNALRTLVGYVDDLRRADFDEGQTKLRLVVNYSQKDTIGRTLSEQLRARIPTDLLQERTSGEALTPPGDRRDQLAFWHTLLYHLKQGWKLELRELLTRAFKGAGIEGRWTAFRQQVVAGYAEGLEAVLAWVEANAGDGPVDPDDVLRRALEALAGEATEAAAPTEPAAMAPAPASAAEPLPPPSPDLLSAIEAAGLSSDAADDLRVDAQLLAIELRKSKPNPARLAELEKTFLAASEAVATTFRGVLGGEAAYAPERTGTPVRDADAKRGAEVKKAKPTKKVAKPKKAVAAPAKKVVAKAAKTAKKVATAAKTKKVAKTAKATKKKTGR